MFSQLIDKDGLVGGYFDDLFDVDGLLDFDDSFLNLDGLSLLFDDVERNLLLDNSSNWNLSVTVGSGTSGGDGFSYVSDGRFTLTNDGSGVAGNTGGSRVSVVGTDSALNLVARTNLGDGTRSIGRNQLDNGGVLGVFSSGDLMNAVGSLTNLRLSQKSFLVEVILVEDLGIANNLRGVITHL